MILLPRYKDTKCHRMHLNFAYEQEFEDEWLKFNNYISDSELWSLLSFRSFRLINHLERI